MSLFVDASALVAVLAPEVDGLRYSQSILKDDAPLWSPISRWETIVALSKLYTRGLDDAIDRTDAFAAEANLRMISIGPRENELALDAHARFGRGRNRARLNMGDCFAYACAKANGARLLYKGNDFALTDLA